MGHRGIAQSYGRGGDAKARKIAISPRELQYGADGSPVKNFKGRCKTSRRPVYHVSSRGATSRCDNANLVGRIIISRPVREDDDDDDVKKAEGLALTEIPRALAFISTWTRAAAFSCGHTSRVKRHTPGGRLSITLFLSPFLSLSPVLSFFISRKIPP